MKQNKILLANGCYCSMPKISPLSAYGKNASTKMNWYIQYRFYDPENTDFDGKIKPHQVLFKGGNEFKNVMDRRAVCKQLIENELEQLKERNYNPFTGRYMTTSDSCFDVDASTPFIAALWLAYKELNGVKGTLIDIKSVITGVEKSARSLGFDTLPVSKITRKYIYAILKRCRETNERFSDNRHNMYRAYLMKLFKQLRRMEAVDINPMHDIDILSVPKKIRKTLTMQQRALVNKTLHENQYYFWRLLQVFFHSGARETELMKVQGKHVDLVNQICRYTTLKGNEIREVDRPIKDIALPLWIEIMRVCGPDDYLFSRNLQPGPVHIRPDQITRRWKKYVKEPKNKGGLGIDAGFYSLKHSNYTETTDILNQKFNPVASDKIMIEQTGHKNTAMAVVYDINRTTRHHKELIEIKNSFGGDAADA